MNLPALSPRMAWSPHSVNKDSVWDGDCPRQRKSVHHLIQDCVSSLSESHIEPYHWPQRWLGIPLYGHEHIAHWHSLVLAVLWGAWGFHWHLLNTWQIADLTLILTNYQGRLCFPSSQELA